MNKGKVIDIQKKYVVVMNDQMAYEKIEKKKGLSLGKEIYYFKEDLYKARKQPIKKYFLVAAVLFMMLFIQPLLVAEETYGYISVDINPSVELQVNKELNVLAIEAINEDAKIIIKDEWVGKSAREVINFIIEETKSKGILNTKRNFVLVSYYFNDEDPTSEEVFIQSLDQLFNEKPYDYEVAVIRSDAETYSEAKEAKESLGKQVVNKKMNTKVDDLLAAKASIEADEDFRIYKDNDDEDETFNEKALEDNPGRKNEKNPIFGDRDDVPGLNKQNENEDENKNENEGEDDDRRRENNNDQSDDVLDEEIRQTRKMITPPEAKAIALALVKGRIIEIELDRNNSEAEYEIDMILDEERHALIIDGFTGDIISHKIDKANDDDEDKDDTNKKNNSESNKDSDDDEKHKEKSAINEKIVENTAFKIIGGQGEILTFDFDRDEKKAEYTLEIQSDGKIHKMKFDGFTGELIEHEIETIEKEDDTDALETSDDNEDESLQDLIDQKTAKAIAFNKIGGQGKIMAYDFDEDDAEYTFEILFNNRKHKIKINGFTGKVNEYKIDEQDVDDHGAENETVENNSPRKNNPEKQNILLREAIEMIALEFVDGEIIEFSIEEDDEILEYRVLIKNNEYLYELIINGFTGEIIEHEKERIEARNDESDDDEEDRINTEKDDD